MDSNVLVKENADKEIKVKEERLWTPNLFLLWQGQLVSAFGDIIYEMALGFWILAVTGSTGLMGTLMAASMVPRIVIAPFAGVIVDRVDRKRMLVLMDIIRGAAVTLAGTAGILGFLRVWMVFAAGIILGICAAFFNPSVSSSIPDIVPKSKLVKANSVFNMIYTGSNIVGSSFSGAIYNILGAPVMFLFNGVSYLFSAFSVAFIKIPKLEQKNEKVHFFQDMKDGFVFVWRFKGLKYLIFIASIMNFFANMAIVLFLPMFQRNEALGPVKYGMAMSSLTGGMFLGMLFTSIVNIPPVKRYFIFIISSFIFSGSAAIVPLLSSFKLIVVLLFTGGIFNAVLNSFIMASAQQTVPQNMRGKVFALLGTISQALTPIGMALGGILAEFIPITAVISGSFLITLIVTVIFLFLKSFKRFINFDTEKNTLEDIL